MQKASLRFLQWMARLKTVPTPWMEKVASWFSDLTRFPWARLLHDTIRQCGWTWQPPLTLQKTDELGRLRVLHLGWDGHCALHAWLEHSWKRDLFRAEERVWKPRRRADPGLATGLVLPCPNRLHLPVMDAQKQALSVPFSTTTSLERQVVYATGITAWHAAKRHDIPAPACLCGLPEPSMPHVLWKCEALRHERDSANTREERLLAMVVPPDPRPLQLAAAIPKPPEALKTLIGDLLHTWLTDKVLFLATDGGARTGCAAWAVASSSTTHAESMAQEDR